jgi:hypothetical protein
VAPVRPPAKEDLHAVERRAVDEGLVGAGVPGAEVIDLADVGSIGQQLVQLRSGEPRLGALK